ncbi:putative Glycosyltransferase [Candidatus Sulfobium mesophilum]|uniref:Putative Glycosyltransferase n=1 Tax=Candidatus Sulfobium mesophilum TaxID=2016548 RepID=A0A2U3QGU2_9BACT|nr:putative Glycosyltransferase [Candidatus Sulfobium mesophilum]
MTISIITPSYNQAQFLAETIQSVLGQEGDFNLDYIIVDGGSTDDSVAIIKHFERLLGEGGRQVKCRGINYRWISEKDKGQTDALIKGFRMAEGEILAWLNSDDIYLPDTLQTVSAFFRENPGTALLYGDAHYCDTDGKIIGRYPAEDFNLRKLAYFNFICQPSTFFRREAFEAVGGLDERLHFAMDFDLSVRICKQFPCCYLPRFFSKYRLHEVSKTVRDDVLFENYEEMLHVARKYFDWAPLSLVYGSCTYYCLARLPRFLTRFRSLVIGAALFCTLPRSLWLNRGLRREDLKLLSLSNFRKMFKKRMEILRG